MKRVQYKTRICRHYQNGGCKLGDRCHFAHGEGELRSNEPMTYEWNYLPPNHEEYYTPYSVWAVGSNVDDARQQLLSNLQLLETSINHEKIDFLDTNIHNGPIEGFQLVCGAYNSLTEDELRVLQALVQNTEPDTVYPICSSGLFTTFASNQNHKN